MTPRIAIIGAGPGGLTLARLLHRHNIASTVFEQDASAAVRATRGGTLDLHEESGQAAVRAAGLWDEFQRHARYEGEDFVLTDRVGNVHVDIKDRDTGRPEIDRPALQRVLLASVPEEYVQWGRQLRAVEPDGTLRFADGSTAGAFDLVVGADGAWSKVRPRLTHMPPSYSGISGVELWLRDLAAEHPDLDAMVGRGSFFAFGDEEGRALMAQRQGDGSVRVYAFGSKPESWIQTLNDSGVDLHDRDAAVRLLHDEYAAWAPKLRALITACNGPTLPRALYHLPVGIRWPHRPGFTLLGDAAHLMTPFAGEGVNAAMHDALELARAIVESPDDLPAATERYEKNMFPRVERIQKKTWDSLMSRFDRGGTREFAERINGLLRTRAEAEAAAKAKEGAA